MSTQSSGHSPNNFSVTTPFRSMRLLEVPDDLLDIITSASASSTTTKTRLKLKSAPPRQNLDQNQTSTQKEGILHLCVDGSDKAWAIKQVSTSNSVYLIEPTRISSTSLLLSVGDDNTDDDALQNATAGAVTAVAQVGNFLELHPVKIDGGVVERALMDTVPIYHPLLVEEREQMDIDLNRHIDPIASITWEEVIDNIAAPDDIILRLAQRLGIFEDINRNCMIPSTRAVLDVWSKIIEGSAIEGVKLDHDLSIVRLVNLLPDDTDSLLAEKLLDVNGTFDQLGLFHNNNTSTPERKLNPKATCPFIAGLILSSHPQHQMRVDDFTTKWTDLVPTSFIKHCTLESLTTTTSSSSSTPYEITSDEDETKIIKWTSPTPTLSNNAISITALSPRSTDSGPTGSSSAAEATGGKPAASSAAADKKRKWHEKFGAQRNMKK